MWLDGDPIWVRTLSSHWRGPSKWISIQHGVEVTSCRWYSAPQPLTNDILKKEKKKAGVTSCSRRHLSTNEIQKYCCCTRSLKDKGHDIQGSLVKPYVVNQGVWRHCYYIAAKGQQLVKQFLRDPYLPGCVYCYICVQIQSPLRISAHSINFHNWFIRCFLICLNEPVWTN